MTKANTKKIIIAVIVLLLILIAYIPALLWWSCGIDISLLPKYRRGVIYISLFTAYAFTIQKRIVQVNARHFIIGIMVLEIFWIFVKEMRWQLTLAPEIARLMWYLYYIPLLMIPTLFLLLAFSLRKPESYRLPKRTVLIPIVSLLLILAVLSNELHYLVFSFPGDPGYGLIYSYEVIYWLVIGWGLILTASAMLILIRKCRIPNSRKILWLPWVPFGICIVYSILYITVPDFVKLFAKDMTVFLCLLYTATLEACIQCGLIQSNTHYDELFRASTIAAQIVDPDYRPYLSSDVAVHIPKDTMGQTENAPVVLPNHIRLSGAPISGGHVLWTEDISALSMVLEELEDAGEYLKEKNETLVEEYKTSRRRRHLAEQNRLYNLMQNQTEDRVALLSELVEQLAAAPDEHTEKQLLYHIAVIGVYIKRRNNLIFLAEEQRRLPVSELGNCIKETMQALTLSGVHCDYQAVEKGTLSFSDVMALYDTLETVIELVFASLTDLFITITFESGQPTMTLRLSGPAVLPHLGIETLSVENEDEGEWLLICRALEGGEHI